MQGHGAYSMDNNGSSYMAVYGPHRHSWTRGVSDYANVGISGDHQNLGLASSKLSSLASWSGKRSSAVGPRAGTTNPSAGAGMPGPAHGFLYQRILAAVLALPGATTETEPSPAGGPP